MDDQQRGDDAADHAPQPKHKDRAKPPGPGGRPNSENTTDDGQALEPDDVSSANDE